MVKIGTELPKLSQKIKLGILFLDHPVEVWLVKKIKDWFVVELQHLPLYRRANTKLLFLE